MSSVQLSPHLEQLIYKMSAKIRSNIYSPGLVLSVQRPGSLYTSNRELEGVYTDFLTFSINAVLCETVGTKKYKIPDTELSTHVSDNTQVFLQVASLRLQDSFNSMYNRI